MSLSLTLLCLTSILIHELADGSTYHIALLGSPDDDITRVLNYRPSPENLDPVFSSRIESCVAETDEYDNLEVKKAFLQNTTCRELFTSTIGISANGIKVENVDSLHVFTMNQDGFMAIPDEHLGNEYYVITYCSSGGFCQLAVVGTESQTNVNMIFPRNVTIANACLNKADLPGHAPDGVPVSFILHESEVFYFESQQDLSGTYVYSNKVVSVFVGSRNIPSKSGTMASLVEHIPPTSKWGNTFIVAPFHLNKAGDVVKILSLSSSTEVNIPGLSPIIIDKKGQSMERRIDWNMYGVIKTSNPALVVQIFSVDLFNGTSFDGNPAMTIVLHSQQLNQNRSMFRCDEQQWYSVVTITNVSEVSYEEEATSSLYTNGVVFEHFEDLSDHNSGVAVILYTGSVLDLQGADIYKGGYTYCGLKMAMPLDADWNWERVDCVPTVPYPGDGIDNDCDGDIDEHTCNAEELGTAYHFNETSIGEVTHTWTYIRGARHLTIHIKSCTNVILNFRNDAPSQASMTFSINPISVSVTCFPNYADSVFFPNDVLDCDKSKKYILEWYQNGNNTEYRVTLHEPHRIFTILIPDSDYDYDKLFVTALGGTADVNIDVPQKDCKNYEERGEDIFGRRFTVPLMKAPYFDIIITALDADTVVKVSQANISFLAKVNQSYVLNSTDFSSITSQVIIKSLNADIAVYFTTNESGWFKGMHIYPHDTAGNVYQLRAYAAQDPSCLAYATNGAAVTPIETFFASVKNEISEDDYDSLGRGRILKSDRPIVVFCRYNDESLVQFTPKETFGQQFYIPPIDLTATEAEGHVRVVASEDSTVVVYKERYDELITLEKTGDEYIRNLSIDNDDAINVTSSKPIQVLLHLRRRSTNTGMNFWTSVINIPSVEQYSSKHYFPGFGFENGYQKLRLTTAVDMYGNTVPSGVSNLLSEVQVVSFPTPTFSITSLQTNFSQIVIVSSTHMLRTINKDCVVNYDTPGDGVDGDCDILIDEEECSLYNYDNTSFIDTDLDGNLNQDCSNNTIGPVFSPESIENHTWLCPESVLNTPTTINNTVESIVIEVYKNPVTDTSDLIEVPPLPNKSCLPIYEPPNPVPDNAIPLPDNSVDVVTTNYTESCLMECTCPCGWVVPAADYTPDEIQSLVSNLQNYLSVTKPSLSVNIRKKTSAKDGRPQAVAIGYIALLSLLAMIGSVVILDTSSLVRDIRNLITTVRSILKKTNN